MKLKVFEFLNRFVPSKKNLSKGIFNYGNDNLLPNNNLKLINDSGIAKKAVGKLKRYIEADGFTDKTLSQFKVNPYQTADELLAEISSQVSYFSGIALTIDRNAEGKIAGVKTISFECVRVREDGNYTYNPLLGRDDFNEPDTKVHPKFFGKVATFEQLSLITSPTRKVKDKEVKNEFFGNPEILYVFEKTADNPYYPVPDYNAGIEDLKTSVELQLIDVECAENSYMPSAIMSIRNLDDNTKDDKGKTERENVFEELKKFSGQHKNKDGRTGRFRISVFEVSSMEEAPKIEKFDMKPILEGTIQKRDQIERNVSRWFGVHPVLLGYSDAAILGNTQAIANASKDLVDVVNPIQRMITRTFSLLWEGDWNISQFNYWNVIPSEVWAVISEDEKRAIAGLPPLEKQTPAKSQLILEAISTIPALVANEVLKSLTEDEKRQLIGLEPLTPEQLLKLTPTNGIDAN